MTTDTNGPLHRRQALIRWLDENTSMDSRECIHVAGGILNRLDEFSALTTERAKVAALEAEVERLGEDSCEWADLFIAAKAEATRWREVAGECAGALEKIDDWFPDGNAARAALARYKQESGQ